MLKIMHIGVPVKEPQVGEVYNEGLKVYITNPDECKYSFECLRFDEDTPMHKDIVNNIHVAYKVDSLDEYLKKYEVLQPACVVNENLRMAFVKIDGVVAELMEMK